MMDDPVNHPRHYECEAVTETHVYQPIDLCETCGFALGSCLKYLFRFRHKGNPVQDLEKALWYLSRAERYGSREYDLAMMRRFREKEWARACVDDRGVINPSALRKWIVDTISRLRNPHGG